MRLEVRCDSLAPSVVRHALAERCGSDGPIGDVMLVASELVTNAVTHSGAAASDVIEVRIGRGAGRVSVSVSDPGWRADAIVTAGGDPDPPWGGWGLRLVDRLSLRWGSQREDDGRHRMWAEIPLAQGPRDHLPASCS